jgi:hypothetical protein
MGSASTCLIRLSIQAVMGLDKLAVSVYDLIPHQSEQLEMFSQRSHAVAEAMDKINDKYGEFVITPALMMGMDDTIIDRIAFGGVKELEELYQEV